MAVRTQTGAKLILSQGVLRLLPEYGAFMLNGQVLDKCRYHCEGKGKVSPYGGLNTSKNMKSQGMVCLRKKV